MRINILLLQLFIVVANIDTLASKESTVTPQLSGMMDYSVLSFSKFHWV